MKISICNELFKGWDIERVFDYAARLGYDGVELAPFTLGETVSDISIAYRRRIRAAADRVGIKIVGLHWLLVKPEGLYINHPDDSVRKKTQNYLRELIDLCGDLGGSVLVHGSPQQRNIKEGWDPGEAWKSARETFQVCAEAAQSRNVYYCLEALTAADTNFINTIDQALKMVDEIDHPNFQTMLDCRSIHASAKSQLPRVLKETLETGKLKHVHVNDPNGRGPGFGDLQFSQLLKILHKADYEGFVSVEVFDFEPDPQTIAGRSVGYLHGIFESLSIRTRIAHF
ncbi:MAG: sugar phosphate isomerase/epimerase family protein [Desulfobacterales bacterium]|nr:sugar phosphate isomerase/epimerase family protein [Desulfobacterales bacterium]